MGSELISWGLYAYVIFYVGSKAFSAYQNQFSNWPIIAGVAGLYAVIGAVRRILPLPPEMGIAFWILSIVCIYGTSALYNHGARS